MKLKEPATKDVFGGLEPGFRSGMRDGGLEESGRERKWAERRVHRGLGEDGPEVGRGKERATKDVFGGLVLGVG